MKRIAELNDLYLKYDDPEVFALADYGLSYIRSVMKDKHEPKVVVQEEEVQEEKPLSKHEQFKIYNKEVWRLTEKQDLSKLVDIDKRHFKGYHLDHKASIWFCFKNGVPEEVAADIRNLRMIPFRENILKGRKCFWDGENKFIREFVS